MSSPASGSRVTTAEPRLCQVIRTAVKRALSIQPGNRGSLRRFASIGKRIESEPAESNQQRCRGGCLVQTADHGEGVGNQFKDSEAGIQEVNGTNDRGDRPRQLVASGRIVIDNGLRIDMSDGRIAFDAGRRLDVIFRSASTAKQWHELFLVPVDDFQGSVQCDLHATTPVRLFVRLIRSLPKYETTICGLLAQFSAKIRGEQQKVREINRSAAINVSRFLCFYFLSEESREQ